MEKLMQRIIYGFILVLALFITSCDRFEHTFEPLVTIDPQEVLFIPLQSAFDSVTVDNITAIMAFYDDDYLHNNQQKADREAFYLSLLQQNDSLSFSVSLLNQPVIAPGDTISTVIWKLLVKDNQNQTVADSTFIGEKIIKRGNSWLLYGNRDTCCPPVTYKQRVFIETFTYRTCPNCPIVENLLHQLQIENPFNLSYLEYHVNDEMEIGNIDVYGYYGYPQMPSVIFQGTNRIIGSNTDNEQIYNQLVNQIAATDSKINLSNPDFIVSGQALSGTIRLTLLDQSVDTTQLKLKYAIIDKESTYFNNYAGDPCRNVVLAKGTKPLQGIDLSQPVYFNLPLNNLPLVYGNNLPIDSYLIIWVQVTPEPFSSNATVFNALETYIPINKVIK